MLSVTDYSRPRRPYQESKGRMLYIVSQHVVAEKRIGNSRGKTGFYGKSVTSTQLLGFQTLCRKI